LTRRLLGLAADLVAAMRARPGAGSRLSTTPFVRLSRRPYARVLIGSPKTELR
jgi:hypothetical protein